MKILGVALAHPLRKITGATNAAYYLSQAIGKEMPYTLAMMWDKNEFFKDGELEVFRFRSTNILSPLIWLLPRFAYIPLYSSRIPKFIEERNFDLVHIHNPVPTLAMKEIAKICLRNRIPYCISTHGFMEIVKYASLMKFGFLKRKLVRIGITNPFMFVIKNATWIFKLSPTDDVILRKLSFPIERSSCVTNGVNNFFMQTPPEMNIINLRKKLKIDRDKNPKLLFMGSLYPYKGVDTFLASLHYLPYPVTAIIGGKLKSTIEKEDLLRQANASLLDRHRIIFTGWLSDTELRSLYHLADIFVYPTRGDTLPLCVLEAMASGLPIIATSVGGIPFQVENGAGFLMEPDQPQAAAHLAMKLIANVELRNQVGMAARKRAEEIFNWDKSALDAIHGYRRILESDI